MRRGIVTALHWLTVLGFCAAIFAMSASRHPPGSHAAHRADMALGRALSSTPRRAPRAPQLFDKVVHALAYATMSGLVFAAISRTRPRWRFASRGAFAVSFCVLYGVSDEVHQRSTPGRSASVGDLAADTVGALAAVGVLRMITARSAQRGT